MIIRRWIRDDPISTHIINVHRMNRGKEAGFGMKEITDEKITEWRDTALKYELHGWELLYAISNNTIKKVCNGIGPSSFPEELRTIIDKLNPTLEIVAVIHDLRFHFGKGTDADFKNANSDFRTNGHIMADVTYGWYNPLRYHVRRKSTQFAAMCQMLGKGAYDSAIREREREEERKEKEKSKKHLEEAENQCKASMEARNEKMADEANKTTIHGKYSSQSEPKKTRMKKLIDAKRKSQGMEQTKNEGGKR